MKFNRYLLIVMLSVSLSVLNGCGEDRTEYLGGTTTDGTTTPPAGPASEGETLYLKNCATSCHGVPTTLAMSSRTVDKIKAKKMEAPPYTKVTLTDEQLKVMETYLLAQP